MVYLIEVIVIFLIVLFVVLKVLKKDKGEYECRECHCIFEPNNTEILFSMHADDTRYLNCPDCHRKQWCKKVY